MKRYGLLSAGALLISLPMILSIVINGNKGNANALGLFAISVCAFGACLIFFAGADKAVDAAKQKRSDESVAFSNRRKGSFPHWLFPQWSTKNIAAHALVMMLIWMPVIIVFAPGTMGWDTYYQIFQYYPDHGPLLQIPWGPTESWISNQFCDHHPLFDTLVFGWFAYTSDGITGSWNCGLAIYTLLQCVAMSSTFSIACSYLARLNVARGWRAGAYLFYCFFPVIPFYAVAMLKDTLFSWLYVLYFVCILEFIRSDGKALSNKRIIGCFTALALLLCLTKKTGLYVVIVVAVVLLAVFRKGRKQLLISTAIPCVVMVVVLPVLVFPALDVAPGGRQEALGILFQQTARVACKCDDAHDWEKEAIDAVLPYEKLKELYDPKTNDPVKNSYRWDSASTDDLKSYLHAWFSQGLRHPGTYLRATFLVVEPFFNPFEAIGLCVNQGYEVDSRVKAGFADETSHFRQLSKEAYVAVSKIPIVEILFSNVLYCWIVPMWAMLSILFRRVLSKDGAGKHRRSRGLKPFRMCMPLFTLLLMTIASYLIAPVLLSRYILPLIYVSPLLIGIVSSDLFELSPKIENNETRLSNGSESHGLV